MPPSFSSIQHPGHATALLACDGIGHGQREPNGPVAVQVDRVAEPGTVPAGSLHVEDGECREPCHLSPHIASIGIDGPNAPIPIEPGGLGRRQDPVDRDSPGLARARNRST